MTFRDAVKAGLLELSKIGNYRLGKETGEGKPDPGVWMEEISADDALVSGYGDMTQKGKEDLDKQLADFKLKYPAPIKHDALRS